MNRTVKMRIAVLLGGDSPERDVSIASGIGIVAALRARGHEVTPVDPVLPLERQGELESAAISEAPPAEVPVMPRGMIFGWLGWEQVASADVVFIALHGGAGENGTVQAILETAGCAYTGTGVMGSALAMNKDRSKALFSEAGVQTAPHILTRAVGDIETKRVRATIEAGLGFPVIVKPNDQGSSVGFSFVPDPSGLDDAIEEASKFADEIIVEQFIPGREITVAILDGSALPVVEIIPYSGFYDYRSKYTKGTSRYEVPASLEEKVADRVKREAVLAYNALYCRDYARVDFRLSESGEPYCLEVNTLPGMTGLSLVPMAAAEAGIGFEELVEKLCLMAAARNKK